MEKLINNKVLYQAVLNQAKKHNDQELSKESILALKRLLVFPKEGKGLTLEGIEVLSELETVVITSTVPVDVKPLLALPNLKSVTFFEATVENIEVLFSIKNLEYTQVEWELQDRFIRPDENKTKIAYDQLVNQYRKAYGIGSKQYEEMCLIPKNVNIKNVETVLSSKPKLIPYMRAFLPVIEKDETWLEQVVVDALEEEIPIRYAKTLAKWQGRLAETLLDKYDNSILKEKLLKKDDSLPYSFNLEGVM